MKAKYPTLTRILAESNPSLYKTPVSMTEAETFNSIRQDLMAELDAINLYEAHKAAATDQELVEILNHIIAEEKDHIKLLQDYLIKHGQWAGEHGADYKLPTKSGAY